ncbi:MAG: glycosyltransferase [Actinomycetales bacterium]|nr:glycosyltransferase [Actinomycetales bacterium]
MTKHETDDPRPHVVMAVASPIARDARVRKSALAVAASGRRVTLVYGDHEGTAVVEGELGDVRTIGLPVPYLLRDDQRRRRIARRAWRPVWPGYRSDGSARAAAVRSQARLARAAGGPVLVRGVAVGLRRVHLLRARAHRVLDRVAKGLWRRWDRAKVRRGRVSWRRDLPNIADLEAVFTSWLWRLEPDVLHIHDIHLLGAGVQAARRLNASARRVPLVYDAHEYVPGMTGGDPILEAGYRAMEADLVHAADAIITVSDPIADALVERYRLAERPTVVLNTPADAAPTPCDRDVRSATGVGPKAPLLVYSGVLGRLRNLDALIQALDHLDGVHLAAVCVPNAHYPVALALADSAARHGVADRFHLVEPVPPEEILAFLATADVGVHPMTRGLDNHEMALPNKLFDYVYAGLPVAVSATTEMRRFVHDHGVGATFEPDDPIDVARAVREVLADLPRLREAVRDPGLRREYSWQHQASRIAGVYERLS